ncbi:MAG: EamA family transporter, partial [Eubacteriales bacterium]
ASILLGFEGAESLTFCPGSLFVLAACLCWGFENNCTKRLSHKSATEIVVIKGLFSGAGSLLLALAAGERIPSPGTVGAVLLLGFVSYGLSIRFYVMAQNRLGAAKTSAYYSIAPFLGVLFSLVLLRERPGALFYPALALMLAAAVILVRDSAGGQTPPDAIS